MYNNTVMKKVPFFLTLALMLFSHTSFTPSVGGKVNWMSIDEIREALLRSHRPVLIDLYTDWCGWCKVMDRETYSSSKVADYINSHYYPLKFNAEQKDEVVWNGKTYSFDAANKTNSFAIYLTGGQLSYPTTVFLAAPDAQPAPLPGYLKPSEIEPPLKFFGDGAYKSQNYPAFMKTFKGSW